MSYCRFSCENYGSDVYVYDAEDGVCIHVARSRFIGEVPEVPSLDELAEQRVTARAYAEAMARRSAFLEQAPTRIIGGQYDGITMNGLQLGEAAEWLLRLKQAGYRVPDYAVEGLLEEALAEDTEREGLS